MSNKKNMLSVLPGLENQQIRINSQVPIMTPNKFIVGYWDVVVYIGAEEKQYSVQRACIEIRPMINNFAIVLRQINTYRRYQVDGPMSNKPIWVFLFTASISQEMKDAFEAENVHVLLYPGVENNGSVAP